MPYPLHRFPHLAEQAAYEASRELQTPDALTGMTILTALSTSLQGLIDVRLPNGLERPVCLNIAVIANSGERKSGLERIFLQAIHDHDEEAIKEYNVDTERYTADLAYWHAIEKGLASRIRKLTARGESTEEAKESLTRHIAAKPVKPRQRRIHYLNATFRAVLEALNGDGESIAFISDEGQVLLKSGAFQQLGMLNKGWDGARSLPIDRAHGETLIARNPRVSISMMIQDDILMDYLDQKGKVSRGSGHWARYLFAWPESTQGTRFIRHLTPQWYYLPLFTKRMKEVLAQRDERIKQGRSDRILLKFSSEADDRWIELTNTIEEMIQPNDTFYEIRDASSKAMEIVGRIAALFHYFSDQEGDISLDTLNRAADVASWHLTEFKRIFSGEYKQYKARDFGMKLGNYLQRRYADEGQMEVEKNEVLRNGVFANVNDLNTALNELCAQGHIRLEQQSRSRSRFTPRAYGTWFIYLNPLHFTKGTISMLNSY